MYFKDIKISIYNMFDNLSEKFYNVFKFVGNNTPFLLFLKSLYFLHNKHTLFFYYIIGFFINILLNLILKGILQQPRPMDDIKKFNLALKEGRYFVFNEGIIPLDIFGMPSGHAQMCMYSTMFVYLSLKNNLFLYSYLFFTIISMAQRVVFKYHTILQVIIGGIVGSLFGYYMYYIAEQKIKGIIREKKDDDAPI